jgi:hypothetical protein
MTMQQQQQQAAQCAQLARAFAAQVSNSDNPAAQYGAPMQAHSSCQARLPHWHQLQVRKVCTA